jgi:hypothetical protein
MAACLYITGLLSISVVAGATSNVGLTYMMYEYRFYAVQAAQGKLIFKLQHKVCSAAESPPSFVDSA